MLEQETLIVVALTGIITILGYVNGVVLGIFLTSITLWSVSLGVIFFIIILLILVVILLARKSSNRILVIRSFNNGTTNARLSKRRIILAFIVGCLSLTIGVLIGVLLEILLNYTSASLTFQLIVGAVFTGILLIVLLLMLLVGFVTNEEKRTNQPEEFLLLPESVSRPNTVTHAYPPSVSESQVARSQVLTIPHDGPSNTATRAARHRSRYMAVDTSGPMRNISVDDSLTRSTNTFQDSRSRIPLPTIQQEYQKLLNPSPRYYVNDKVYTNENDLVRINEVDGMGNYQILYPDGHIEYRSGEMLRKALPMIT